MSTINLSEDLLREIQQVLEKYDERNRDMGISSQYLAAILGILVTNFPGTAQQRQDVLQQLYGISDEVLRNNSEPDQPASTGGDDACGVWKPGDN